MSRRIRISLAGLDALRVLASRGALPRHPSGSGWGMGMPDGGPLVSDKAAAGILAHGFAVTASVPDAPSPATELRLTGAGQIHLVQLQQTMPATSLSER
ncbi:hypothetical protein [Methylobacterium fujisawaense]